MPPHRPLLVIEDDSALRFMGVILATDIAPARIEAFRDFFAHDLPDFDGWLRALRSRLPTLYPAEVVFAPTLEQMKAALPRADALIVESYRVNAADLAAAPQLRMVQKFGTILTNVDQNACTARNIPLLTLRRRANMACAEHTLGMMLALARKIHQVSGMISLTRLRAAGYTPKLFDQAHTANSNWARIPGIRTLSGSQLGIIGCGEIGRELALRAAACGMKIVYTQRNRMSADDEARYQAAYVGLDELLACSDCVSVHLPGGPSTRGFLGRREIALMKARAVLINNSRAELIDREALVDALKSGRLGAFATDVPYEEPGRDEDPLLTMNNVIMTPHIAAQPRFNFLSDFEEMATNLDRALKGQPNTQRPF